MKWILLLIIPNFGVVMEYYETEARCEAAGEEVKA
jgi:hypothetical protein